MVLLVSILAAGCGPSSQAADGSRDAAIDAHNDIAGDIATDTAGQCQTDRDCDNAVFCDGVERCMPGAPGASARGCLPASPAAAMIATTPT